MREIAAIRKKRAVEILDALNCAMPDAKIELDYQTPLELLVAVILSAQCTDKRVNKVTPTLFNRYPDAQSYATSSSEELEGLIRSCGFFRAKAKNIQGAARTLVQLHGGAIPIGRIELAELAGVGQKTAGVVSIHLGGAPAFPVDTHVGRLARRMGLTRHTDPDKVERDLQALFPPYRWAHGHQLFIWHGRRTCMARSPACERCPVEARCPKVGVKASTKKRPRARP